MTVRNTQTYVIYQGNGSTVQWDIPFAFLNKEDLLLFLIDEKGNKTALTADFEIDEENNLFFYPQTDSDALPLPDGQRLLLQRKTPLSQETEFLAQQMLDPHILEQSYDKAMLVAQELAAELERAVKFPLESQPSVTDASAYLQALEQAKQDAQTANDTAQESMSTATQAAQTAIQASTRAAQAVADLQHYQEGATRARDEAVQAQQTATEAQERVLQAESQVQTAVAQSLTAQQNAQNSAATAEQYAQDLQTAQEACAQSALNAQSSAQAAQQSQAAAAQSAQTLQTMQELLPQKADRDLGNVSADIDFVTESFSDENGNWYRVYKSGWVEQGGQIISPQDRVNTITFLKPFADTSYYFNRINESTVDTVATNFACEGYNTKTTTSIAINANAQYAGSNIMWHACGQGA